MNARCAWSSWRREKWCAYCLTADAFHVPCMDQWLMGHTIRPIFRYPVVAEVIPVVVHQENDRPHHPIQQSQENDQTGGERFLLRHCASFMLPTERSPGRLVAGLKRSLSMDQSFLVINMERAKGLDRQHPPLHHLLLLKWMI